MLHSLITPPLSFRDCFNNGKLDALRYLIHRRRIGKNEEAEDDNSTLLKLSKNKRKRKNNAETSSSLKKQRTRRSTKMHQLLFRDDDGVLREIRYTETFWY